MDDGPGVARVAALLGDHARAAALTALMAGRALTATELAVVAGVSKQTISAHLAKLVDAGLLGVERQGRHRYFRLADPDVAHLLESLMGVASRTGAARIAAGPREPALRKARVCYDHLAGEAGVRIFERLVERRALIPVASGIQVTPEGRRIFGELDIDTVALAAGKRPLCRACLDWSERRHHLAGSLGAALLRCIVARGWAKRVRNSRAVSVTPTGEEALRKLF